MVAGRNQPSITGFGTGRLLIQPPRRRRPAHRPESQRLHGQGEATGDRHRDTYRATGNSRRIVVERLARREDERRDAAGVTERDEHLRAAPVVLHECDVREVESLEEFADQQSEAAQREVGVLVHRNAVRAEREGGEDAAEVRSESLHHLSPHGAVDRQPGDEHEDGAVATGVVVLDGACGEVDLLHGAHSI
nr:hypothetical protein GCM10017611_50490 [Rhodococcus wratislaviensis]